MPRAEPKRTYTPQEVADILGYKGYRTIIAKIKNGELRGGQVKGRYRILPEAVEEYLKQFDKLAQPPVKLKRQPRIVEQKQRVPERIIPDWAKKENWRKYKNEKRHPAAN